MSSFCFFSCKINFTCCCTRRCRKCGTDNLSFCQSIFIKCRMKQLIERFCFDTAYCFFFCDHTFINKVTCDLKSSLSCTFTVTCLQEVEFSFLDCKFHILHITIMIFKFHGKAHELFIAIRHIFCQFCDRLWCTNTGNNVFTLSIDQVFTVNTFSTCGRVTCESNTCTRCFTHITEYHSLYVNSCSPITRDIIHTTVYDSTWVVP